MTTPPLPGPPSYYGIVGITTDEDGETYWLRGHHPDRRTLAAANAYARRDCGLVNLLDEHGGRLSELRVERVWLQPTSPERRCSSCGTPIGSCPWSAGTGKAECCESCSHPEDDWYAASSPAEPGAEPWTSVEIR